MIVRRHFLLIFYIFPKNSSKIVLEVQISQNGQALTNSAGASVDVGQLCALIVGIPGIIEGACPVNTSLQQFSSYDDCYEKMTAVNTYQQSKYKQCPDVEVAIQHYVE